MCLISSSAAPSNTGVAIGTPCGRFSASATIFVVGQRGDVRLLAAGLVVDLVEELAQLVALRLAAI